ncbi:MAG: MarR family transcriptional regulator [Parasphingorhabdus sp.]|uniref:MarR family winged helix-turn-helix transcriptional regulator n=1 Tax=Parasphingorhabdus sp. TaxID=2709688 RepID=UPI0030028E22
MSDNLGFVISDITRLIRRTFDQRAKEIGITRPQWRVLTMLNRHQGAKQSELAEMLELDAMTLCRMIDRLQSGGLIERRPDPQDRRAWQLYLTDEATPLINRLRPMGEALLQEAIRGIDKPDQELLQNLLDQIYANLSALDAAEQNERRGTNG